MRRSQLIFNTYPASSRLSAERAVVALHGHAGRAEDMVLLARAIGPDAKLWIPRAPRPAYFGRETVAHYWYVGERDGAPDPPSFGDCLYQVEQFTLDVVDAAGMPGPGPVLLGVGQGAVLALATAKVMPDYLGGVVAVDGYLPRIPGVELPMDDLSGLPVLMINCAGSAAARLGEESAARLTREGARVETHWDTKPRDLGDRDLTDVVATWSARETRPG